MYRVEKLPIQERCDALGMTQVALAKAIAREPWEFLRGPLPGEGLPTEDEARAANLAWFRKLTPSQKTRASETSRKMVLRAHAYVREYRGDREDLRYLAGDDWSLPPMLGPPTLK